MKILNLVNYISILSDPDRIGSLNAAILEKRPEIILIN